MRVVECDWTLRGKVVVRLWSHRNFPYSPRVPAQSIWFLYSWLCIGLGPAYFLAFWGAKNALSATFRNFSFANLVVGKFNRLVSGLTSVLFLLGEPEIKSFQIMGSMCSAWPHSQLSEGPAGHCGIDRCPTISRAAVSAVLNLEVAWGLILSLDTLCQFSTSETY